MELMALALVLVFGILVAFGALVLRLTGIAFGALILAGREIQPAGIPAMIQGIVLMCVIAADALSRYTIRVRRP